MAINSNCPSDAWKDRIKLHRENMTMINIGANSGSNANEFLLRHDPSWNVQPDIGHKEAQMGCGACGACHSIVPRASAARGGVRSIRIIAVELLLLNFVSLKRTFDNFKVPGIALHAAAGSHMGMTHEPKVYESGVEHEGVSEIGIPIPIITVDALHSIFHLPSTVDVLSIDTEGNDPLVLEGAMEGIKRKAYRVIEFEYHGVGAWKRHSLNETVRSKLTAYGYRCFWQGNDGSLSEFDFTCNYEFHGWSNIVCTHEPRVLSVMEEMCIDHASIARVT